MRNTKWGLDISEVISNTNFEEDLQLFVDEVEAEARTNPLQTPASIGAMRSRIESTKKDRAGSVPLGCLFAWAANNSKKLTLTANTVGLIGLYGGFGFELDGNNIQVDRGIEGVRKAKAALGEATPSNRDALQASYNDAKFTEVNALMILSQEGRAKLLQKYRLLVDYVGPSL